MRAVGLSEYANMFLCPLKLETKVYILIKLGHRKKGNTRVATPIDNLIDGIK